MYNRSSLVSVVLEKLPDALVEKPGQMTSGVPFHYAGNVKAQLSQWLYPWCKGNSVISFFFPPLCLSLSLSSRPPSSFPPSFSCSRRWRYLSKNRKPRSFCFRKVRAARPLVTSHFGGGGGEEADDGTKLRTFYGSKSCSSQGEGTKSRYFYIIVRYRRNRRIILQDSIFCQKFPFWKLCTRYLL